MEQNTLITRLDEMEIKVMLLEQANEQLSDVMIAQQAAIDSLDLQLQQARAQMARLGEAIDRDDSPPPHY